MDSLLPAAWATQNASIEVAWCSGLAPDVAARPAAPSDSTWVLCTRSSSLRSYSCSCCSRRRAATPAARRQASCTSSGGFHLPMQVEVDVELLFDARAPFGRSRPQLCTPMAPNADQVLGEMPIKRQIFFFQFSPETLPCYTPKFYVLRKIGLQYDVKTAAAPSPPSQSILVRSGGAHVCVICFAEGRLPLFRRYLLFFLRLQEPSPWLCQMRQIKQLQVRMQRQQQHNHLQVSESAKQQPYPTKINIWG